MHRTLSLFLLFALLFLVGCGAKTTQVKGKVMKGDKPFTVSDQGMFIIKFFAEDDKEANVPIPVETKQDGTFVVVGPDRKGIKPGKYRVSIAALDPYKESKDVLGGKFSEKTSTLTVEVKSGEDIVLDVSK